MSATQNIKKIPTPLNLSGPFDAQKRINDSSSPELIIALCGPLGTPLHRVAGIMADQLERQYNYKTSTIRLSDFIREHGNVEPSDGSNIRTLIEAGNLLRSSKGNSILAQMAMREIRKCRDNHAIPDQDRRQSQMLDDDPGAIIPAPVIRHCHIIDSIKNADELNLLRSVYGDLFHLISVYTPIDLRVQELNRRYASIGDVYHLIDRDSGEETESGQSVRNIFPQADFFIRLGQGTDEQIKESIKRYLDLVMGAEIITPTASERAMYAAHSAARNSACLSRQVGASILHPSGDIISVGWNDVPRPFGGLYGEDERELDRASDHRCWNKDGGKCFNDDEKDSMSRRLTSALVAAEIIKEDDVGDVIKKLRKSRELGGLIEFSRAVHAELHALLNAGRTAGPRISGSRLFVTTYPCHSCARHIIAAGITEVRFIEPYRKSLATKLHSDAMTEDERETGKVRVLPFDGVAPSRFLKLFTENPMGRKGPDGRHIKRHEPNPVTAAPLEAITTLEALALRQLQSEPL